MADQDFRALLEEQKKTNDLLIQQGKIPNAVESAKRSLGEIINDRLLYNKDKQFQRDEGTTDIDEKIVEGNVIEGRQEKILDVQSGYFTEQVKFLNQQDALLNNQLVSFQRLVQESTITNQALKSLVLVLAQDRDPQLLAQIMGNLKRNTEAIEQEISMQPTPSQKVAQKKDEDAEQKKMEGLFKGIADGFKNSINTFNKIVPKSGSMLSKLLKLGGLFLLFKFLLGPGGIELARMLDNFTKLIKEKNIGEKTRTFLGAVGERIKKLAKDLDAAAAGEKTAGEVVKENLTTILGAVGILYSRTILATGLGFALARLNIANIAGFALGVKNLAKRLIIGGGFTLGGATFRIAGALALITGIFGGVQFAIEEQLKDEKDMTEDEIRRRNFGLNRLGIPDPVDFISGTVGTIFEKTQDLTTFIVGLLYGEKAKKEAEQFARSRDARKDIKFFLNNMATEIFRYFRLLISKILGIFAPKTEEDIRKELEDLEKRKIEEEKILLKQKGLLPTASTLIDIQNQEKNIKDTELLIEKKKKELELFFPTNTQSINSIDAENNAKKTASMIQKALESGSYQDAATPVVISTDNSSSSSVSNIVTGATHIGTPNVVFNRISNSAFG